MKFCLRAILLATLVFYFQHIIKAQSSHLLPTSKSVAGTGTAASSYSAFSNPASAITSTAEFGFSYENRYLLKELALNSLYLSFPTQLAQFTTVASYTGYSLYNEAMVGFALSRNFDSKFSLGVQYNYLSVYNYETNSRFGTFFPQVGAQVFLTPHVAVAFSAFNPGQQVIKTTVSSKKIPAIYSIGGKWTPTESLRFLMQLDKRTDDPYRIAAGFEYCLKEALLLKLGMYSDRYLVPALGFGWQRNGLSFDLNTTLHPVLGVIPQASAVIPMSKKQH